VGIVGWIQFLHPSDGVTLTAHHIEKRIITNTWDYYKYVGLLQIRGIITNTWDYYKYVGLLQIRVFDKSIFIYSTNSNENDYTPNNNVHYARPSQHSCMFTIILNDGARNVWRKKQIGRGSRHP
jgi:hypothetical protein